MEEFFTIEGLTPIITEFEGTYNIEYSDGCFGCLFRVSKTANMDEVKSKIEPKIHKLITRKVF